MTELATPRQRVTFRLRPGLGRDAAFDAVAGVLMRAKPDRTGLDSLYIYPPGDGAPSDPDIITVMWELAYEVEGERDWDWGHGEQARLAKILEAELGSA